MAREVETKIVATDEFTSTLRSLGKELQKVAEDYAKINDSGDKNEKKLSSWRNALQTVKKGYKSFSGSLSSYNAEQDARKSKMDLLTSSIAENKQKVEQSTSAIKAAQFMLDLGVGRTNLYNHNIKVSTERIKRLNQANREFGGTLGGLTTQYDKHQKKVFNAINRIKGFGSMTKKTASDARKFGKTISKQLTKPITILSKKFPITSAVIRKGSSVFIKAGKEASKLSAKLSVKLGKSYVLTGKIAAEFYKRLGGTGLKVVSQGLSLIGQRLVRINEGFGRIAGGGLKALKQGISDILRGGFQRLVETVRDFSVASIRQFADLELSMKKINIFGNLNLKSEKEFDVLQNSLNEMTRNSLSSMEEVSNAFEKVAAIGDFAKEGVKGLTDVSEAVVKMATATGEADLGRTSAVLMTTMNAFGIASADAMQTASVLTKIANDSALSVNSLGDAMGYVAGTASLAGMSLEETGAALAILSNQGLSASKSGTALNQALQKMTKPTAQSKVLMQELGISFFDAQGNMKDFATIIPELSQTMAGLATDEERLAALGELFGVRGKRAIAALLNDFTRAEGGVTQFGTLLGSLEDIEPMPVIDPDTGQQMVDAITGELIFELPVEVQADEMMDTLAGSMARLQGSLEVMKSNFGELLAPAIGQAADALTTLTQDPAIIEFMTLLGETLAGVVTTLTPLITTLVEGLMPIFEALLPIIDTVVGILMTFFETGEDGTSIFSNLMAIILKIVDVILMLIDAFMPIITMLLDELLPIILELADAFIEYLMPVILEVIDALMPFLEQLMPLIKQLADMMISLMPIIQWVLRLFIQLAQKLMEALMPIIVELINLILDNREMLKSLMLMVGLFITILIALMPIINILSDIIVVLIKALSWLINALVSIVNFIIKGVLWAFDKMLWGIELVVGGLDSMLGMLGIEIDALEDFKNGIKKARVEMSKMGDALGDLAEAEGIDEESLIIDEIPELFADEIIGDIQDQAEEDGLGLKALVFDDDNFDDDLELDAHITNADEVAEHILSGTSVQDILDLQVLTGITPSGVGPEGNTPPNQGEENNTTVYIDNLEITVDDVNPDDPDDFLQKMAEALLGRGNAPVPE